MLQRRRAQGRSAGAVRLLRVRIKILERARVQAHACECYRAVRSNSERLIGEAPSPG